MAGLMLRKCPCLRPKIEEEVRILDYRHSSLSDLPGEVFNFERTLEELYADSNQIRDLPRELFYCHGLRKLSISDNEIISIPPAIASLDNLQELDFSKNGIIDVPDNIKCCKYLNVIDASVNPLGKLPEGFTQLQNLTQLYLNDTFLDYLPGSFGRLVKLRILELRENHLKTLPKSFGRLVELERLDIGNNEFTCLPDVIGSLTNLLELWCDNSQITSITSTIGALKQLMFLDASKNQLQSLPADIEGCTSLADLHLSGNQLHTLPDTIGCLGNLTTLKVDENQLTSLPKTVGGLTSLSELNVSINELEELPNSIGLLRNLRTFYADENYLAFLPAELGSCSGITVLSLRSNKLTYIPDEIGRIPCLRVLNLSDNLLSYLPFTIVKLKELQALWLTENQTRPLIPLQSDYEADTGRKILTCYLLPQGQNCDSDEKGNDGDSDSFHASIWDEERHHRQQIHFDFADDDSEGHLVRCPTPYPKEMREKARHMRNLAMRQSMGDGVHPTAWTPGTDSSPRVQQQVQEAKSQSPSLQETHRLYRCDKEKLMKDKARMQHRQSMPNIAADLESSPGGQFFKQGVRISGGSETADVRVTGRRKSTPNLFSFDAEPNRMPSFTCEDLYQKQFLQKHHSHRQRSRRLREYDSDTGYRNEHEFHQFQKPCATNAKGDVSVRSQPTVSHSLRRQQRREGGYASDLEAYAGQGRDWDWVSNSVTAPSPKPLYPTHSLPHIRTAQDLARSCIHPNSHHIVSNSRPCSSDNQRATASPSLPAQFNSNTLLDQSRPTGVPDSLSSTMQSGTSDCFQTGTRTKDRELQRELYAVLEERSRKKTAQNFRPSSTPSLSSHPPSRETPPPYQPAPPYRGRSDSISAENSPRDSIPGRSSFSSPDTEAQAGSSLSHAEYSAIVRGNKGSKPQTTVHTDDQNRDYETVHRKVNIPLFSNTSQQHRTTYSLDYRDSLSSITGDRRQYCDRTRSHIDNVSDSGETRRHSRQDYSSAGTYTAYSPVSHQLLSEPQTSQPVCDRLISASQSAQPVCDRLISASQSAQPVCDRLISASQSAQPVCDRLISASQSAQPVCDRLISGSQSAQPPQPFDLSILPQQLQGCRDDRLEGPTSNGSLISQKGLEAYHNPYCEPLEVGNPLMSRYDDVAIFKSMQDPSSQVSSSTDSGYGQGQPVYERIGDFSIRRSGSLHSSTPTSHRNTPEHHTTSISHSASSRATTPVKEGHYSVQDHMIFENTSQLSRDVFRIVIQKNPGLGFSIAGGQGSRGVNPFRTGDMGIFVTKVQATGPAAAVLQPGDKILKVNNIDFGHIDHSQAVSVLKTSATVEMLVERLQKINMV